MRKAKLIGEEATWQQLNYSRCGRTDKGVSAAGQVHADSPPDFVHDFASFWFAILQPAAAAFLLCPVAMHQACKQACSSSALVCSSS